MTRDFDEQILTQMMFSSHAEINEMFDTEVFGDIVKGFLAMVLKNCKMDNSELREKMFAEYDRLIEITPAQEARSYFTSLKQEK